MSFLGRRALLGLVAALLAMMGASQGMAQSGSGLDARSRLALDQLIAQSPAAAAIYDKAKAVMIFPNIVRGGFIVGGEYGEGTLFENGVAIGNYAIGAASFGLQIGAQSYSQALFYMTDEALNYLDDNKGFVLGADIGFALGSQGRSGGIDTATGTQPIVAYAFGQQGLMAGVSLQGARIMPIRR